MKKILTAEELVADMRRRGIRFEKYGEADAIQYLKTHNYYMNVAAYRSNYSKCGERERKDKYQNLDFAYLVELSEIDTELKRILFSMCLDIEKSLKTQMIASVSEREGEDGYDIMRAFLNRQKDLGYLIGIKRKAEKNAFCSDLIEKHYPYFPLWVFLELIPFGTLIFFYSFYGDYYNESIIDNKLMNIVRDVRNASAHNNCMLNQISTNIDATKQPHNEISGFIKSIEGISKTSRRNNLRSTFTYSIVTLIYVYKNVLPEDAARRRFAELQLFFEKRAAKNHVFFKNNTKLCSTYVFLKKLIDNLCMKC